MRKGMFCLFCAVAGGLLSACASTSSTILEYDASGKVVKRTETSESVIKTVTDSTKNKSVVVWEDGWAAYISVSSGTTEDPTPHGKIFMGKVNKGAISMLPNQIDAAESERIDGNLDHHSVDEKRCFRQSDRWSGIDRFRDPDRAFRWKKRHVASAGGNLMQLIHPGPFGPGFFLWKTPLFLAFRA